jgi:hypothetical protein
VNLHLPQRAARHMRTCLAHRAWLRGESIRRTLRGVSRSRSKFWRSRRLTDRASAVACLKPFVSGRPCRHHPEFIQDLCWYARVVRPPTASGERRCAPANDGDVRLIHAGEMIGVNQNPLRWRSVHRCSRDCRPNRGARRDLRRQSAQPFANSSQRCAVLLRRARYMFLL